MSRAKRKTETPAPPTQAWATVSEVAPTTARAPDPSLARPMWVYIHHPRAWEIKDGRILPDLSTMPIEDGIGGTSWNERAGKHDLRPLRANLSRAGKYIVPQDVDADAGIPSYVTRPWPGYHVDRWTTLYQGSAQITRDDKGYDDWRASLVQRGIIRAPSYGALREMEAKRARILPRLQAHAAAHARVRPDLEQQIARIEAELVVIREALAKTDAPAPGMALSAEAATVEAL